ncbi:arginase family protein [Streptomyces violaceus]|uniref:Arginase family protein n=1 Tax=Streptomyces violaceus TaxID=1936 RepID=A0ABY9UJT4_STRVL|nr:arginase family protein [Streptomyces janthinus]WND23094.1 arginase family protein [Streptomyces janthinus]GGS55697.1 arginase [Streptomyces janthinus]
MSRPVVLEVAQWQGSGASTARRLPSGAAWLAQLIPAGRRRTVALDNRVGDSRRGVGNADVLERHLLAVRAALAEVPSGERAVIIGGDCSVDLAPVEAALSAFGDRLALVWFDAHGDLNTPESSPSGAFHGMVLRALIGDGPEGLRPARSLSADRVVLAGARSLDPGEQDLVESRGIRHLSVEQLTEPGPLLAAVRATGAQAVYLHIDLDVLDPQVFPAVGTPEPGGLGVDELLEAVRALKEEFTLAGLALTEYERTEPAGGDEAVLRRIVEGLFPPD